MVFGAGAGGGGRPWPRLGKMPAAALFAKQVVTGRWFMMLACMVIMSASGGTNIFSIYSGALKSSLGYDQRTLNTLSFFKELGANAGIVSGLVAEVAPPSAVLAVGACMSLAGYLVVYLAVAGRVARPPLWLMCACISAGADSQAFANTGALVTCVKSFPESRGVVVGLLKGFAGLSGAVLPQLYLAIYGGGHDAGSLILLIAWLPAAISLVFLRVVRVMPHRPTNGRVGGGGSNGPIFSFLYISFAVASYLLVMIVLQKTISFSHAAYAATAIVLLLILLLLPLAVVIRQELRSRREADVQETLPAAAPPPQPVVETPPPPPATTCGVGSCLKRTFNPPAHGEDYTIPQAALSVDMVVLFVCVICGAGGSLTAIDNMGQISQSLGYPARSVNTFASLINIWMYAGRAGVGSLSELLLSRYRFPRPLMLTLVLVVSSAGYLLIALGVPHGLYAASVVVGFSFGGLYTLLFSIVSEVFGLKYYATLYNLGMVASPIGAYIFNVRVAGALYDAEAARQNGGGGAAGHRACAGVRCFRASFLIVTAATFFAVIVSLVLVWRTRGFYRGDIYARFKAAAPAPAVEGHRGEVTPEEASGTKLHGST
ncbi:protein NUCLEAR FUSION DEFECTIVE 4 [Oryza sativa Japonica Group]|uniref:Nodulin-like family protein, expressed n=2 Tax=Oryza sativa subsp. japonica TaxID=39947 RepID=Q7XGH1_ORYSJ|nr:uncharacterized protein LOC107275647 [Oryza sativa Japonica Group]AAM01022.1 Hypothetical protein [Oryza sativa Japonica Group]AAP52330.1 Nodulin-like family protein, expressed [Oryza sativa Japonica Group]EAZ15430.1 hypothetical protein OsJ_30845 [Oryza sativa Japonica Group]KAF2912763.1 hypothetical protein DAI22_10g036700 [Oryza sativa Japonica Group]BAT10062.1 Os10g0169900 [Oryza sativa Japonica Group]